MHEPLVGLYKTLFGEEPVEISPLNAHASNRRMFRLVGPGRSVIGIVNPNRFENRAFLEFSAHFKSVGLPVPTIFGADLDAGIYLEEDLGSQTLYDVLSAARSDADPFPAAIEQLYVEAVSFLPRFQIVAGAALNYDSCHPRKVYDRESMLWDMRFFRDSFVKRAGVAFDEARLEADFERLADFLEEAPTGFFMYRDFQSRNIMVRDGALFFIDYQGGRRGPLQYDVASLLYQAKAKIPADARRRILDAYLAAASRYAPIERELFLRHFYGFVLVRLLQVLGTYGEQGLNLQKTYFVESIPHALRNLRALEPDVPLAADLTEFSRVVAALNTMYLTEDRA